MVYLLVFFLVAVMLVMIIGLTAFAMGGDFNKKYGNKMMRARLIFQACAIVVGMILLASIAK